MPLRSAATATPVLGGAVAGVTFTVKRTLLAGSNDAGEAMPNPEGRVGSPPQEFAGEALLRGIGPIVTKSLALLSVSMQPLPFRTAADVLDNADVGAASKQLDEPSDQINLAAARRASAIQDRGVGHQRHFSVACAESDCPGGIRGREAGGSARALRFLNQKIVAG